jgi:Na+-driven multidrug efflux pump
VSTNTLTTTVASSALDERRAMMLGGPVVSTLLKLTFPEIAVVVAQTFVAILEAYWVSRLGTEAIAGVSLVLPILILMGTMSNGGIGGSESRPKNIQTISRASKPVV